MLSIEKEGFLYRALGFWVFFGAVPILFLVFVSDIAQVFASEGVVDMGLEVKVDTNIAITIDNERIELEVTPSRDGEFIYDTTDVSVSTNNETGYTMTIATETIETALVLKRDSEPTESTPRIRNLDMNATVFKTDKSDFPKDRWGYTTNNKLDREEGDTDTIFLALPSSAIPKMIAEADGPVNWHTTPVTFGAKISTDTLAGNYQNIVVFSAVTNYIIAPTFRGISFMQEMTTDICAAETTPDKTATELTRNTRPGDTTKVPEAVLLDERDGNEYIVRKLADGNCWMSQDLRLISREELNSANSDIVSGTFKLPATRTSAFSNSNNNNQLGAISSNPAYGGGAYYSWYAATAGTGTASKTSGNATNSVCPKGWQLPVHTGDKSYYDLIVATYEIPSSTDGSVMMRQAPLEFVLGGRYNTSAFVNNGTYGYYWTSSANGSTNAYIMRFLSNEVGTQFGGAKYVGRPIRCVAR